MKIHSGSVLVTGVAGFIGRYVARHFSDQGWNVIGIDNCSPENAPLSSLILYERLQLPDPSIFNDLLGMYCPDVCIHCAGRASVNDSVVDPVDDFYSSVTLTFETLNALRLKAPSCRFILLSSAAVYGEPKTLPVSEVCHPAPISPYGFHKWQCEQLCLEYTRVYGLPTAAVRIFSAYGAGLRRQVIWDICRKALTENILSLQGSGQESRDFIHVLDIVKALRIVATSAPMRGEVYNVGSGREVTIADLAYLLLETLGYRGTLEFDGVVPLGTPRNWRADISKLEKLSFSASISLEDGVRAFAKWCQAELTGL